jgi:hypothetical protein
LNGAVDLRVGQLGADQEFMITQYGSWNREMRAR